MYTSLIGKKLVELANKQNDTDKTCRQFFEDIYFPLFYDHEKYSQWITNSPFVQGYKSAAPPDKDKRRENLLKLQYKIENLKPDASFAIGFGAAEDTAATSGQISSMAIPFSEEDIYSSWIGSGLGIGMGGGLVMLLDKPEILLLLREGWDRYRELLNQTRNLKGNQIDTWNGRWLTFVLNNTNYRDLAFLQIVEQKGTAEIPTQSWIKILFSLARKYPNQKLNAYIYNLGQTNTTVGFIQIDLPEVKRELDMYDYLFEGTDGMNKKAIDDVYNTQFSLIKACQNGVIGLSEIRPKDLQEYFPKNNKHSATLPKIKNDGESIINYNIYLSWIIAMLNNKSLIQISEEAANIFLEYEASPERGKKKQANTIRSLLESSSRKTFIETTAELLKEIPAYSELLDSLVEEVNKMQADKFQYFMALVKFKYAYLSHKNNIGVE